MNKRKYQKPAIKTEKMFERTVLACTKTNASCKPSQHVA